MASRNDVAAVEGLLSAADEEQVRLMEEQVIVTDYNDNCIGAGSKKTTHIWSNIEAGMLHRAFSVFLFTPDGKLILQQRSPAKITFPSIWANTCCSHPLYIPSETILEDAMGVKNAARRKLEHELGIPPEDVPLESFTWITRVHYVGASVPEDGSAPLWGEHEIDWILMCTPPRMPRFNLNENEVAAVKEFTQDELRAWMATRAERGDEVSPWFGVMEKGLLYRWWDAVLAKNLAPVLQRDIIHRQHDLESQAAAGAPVPMPKAFSACLAATKSTPVAPSMPVDVPAFPIAKASPPSTSAVTSCPKVTSVEAAVLPGSSASTPKQGAYGKVKIHTESKLSQLSHLDEVWAAITFKLGWTSATKVTPLPADAPDSLRFCENMLVKVSRSFAMVIQQLPPHLRLSICIFYLVLRGLDTVEDDMQAFAGRQAEKLAHLRAFYTYLRDPDWRMTGVGEGDELVLLEKFFFVNRVFLTLSPLEQEVIADICARMGEGMASFAGRDLREGTLDIPDYNLYCHYVAGLVGEGLTRLFVASGDEDATVSQDLKLADDMGLFLQKTNIIRDYLEDLVEGRAFWPREIWSQYAPALANLRHKVAASMNASPSASSVDMDDARYQEDQARACLNHLVADAITLAPACLRYMEKLRNPDVFRFCAIPQLMAIATLDKLTNNADVFTGVVKIRKGQALKLINCSSDMRSTYAVFLQYSRSIVAKIPRHHKVAYGLASRSLMDVEAICLPKLGGSLASSAVSPLFSPLAVVAVAGSLVALLMHLYDRSSLWGRNGQAGYHLPRIHDSWDVAALAATVACVVYLFACAGVPAAMGATSRAQLQAQPTAASSVKSASDAEPLKPVAAVASAAGRERTLA